MHSWDKEFYLPGSEIARRLSWVQMTLGTKVLFVHPCFGMGPVSLLLLLGLTWCHLSAGNALSPPRLCLCVPVEVCTGHDLGFLM